MLLILYVQGLQQLRDEGKMHSTLLDNILSTLLQEYVDLPVYVKMTLDRQNTIRTRSSEQPPPPDVSAVPSSGSFVAVRADATEYEDGFCIAKVSGQLSTHFQGIYLIKISEQVDPMKIKFAVSEELGRFDINTIISEVVSAFNIGSNILEVDKEEIEEIIIGATFEM